MWHDAGWISEHVDSQVDDVGPVKVWRPQIRRATMHIVVVGIENMEYGIRLEP